MPKAAVHAEGAANAVPTLWHEVLPVMLQLWLLPSFREEVQYCLTDLSTDILVGFCVIASASSTSIVTSVAPTPAAVVVVVVPVVLPVAPAPAGVGIVVAPCI
jgi:hypothetical protein